MKKFSAVLIFISSLFLLSACGSSSSGGGDEAPVDEYSAEAAALMGDLFAADPIFEACVQDAIAEDMSSIGSADGYTLASLTALECNDLGITGISGIDSLTGLTNLELDGNGLDDDDILVLPASLTYLNLANNVLVDPSFADLDLASLYLQGNALDSLDLSGNPDLHSLALGSGSLLLSSGNITWP